MMHQCFKQGCELEVQYICLCLASETYSCELHLGAHLKLPSRAHSFDSILVEPREGTKDAVLRFLAKEKSKKEKLKKMISPSFARNIYDSINSVRETLKKLDSDISEINSITKKVAQASKQELIMHEDSESYTSIVGFCRLSELRTRKTAILSTINNPELEQDFRKACSLSENYISDPLISQAYQECVNAYHQSTSLYLIGEVDKRTSLFVYDTEGEIEHEKVLDFPWKLKKCTSSVAQLPNGELFCTCEIDSSPFNVFIIDKNYGVRVLPTQTKLAFSLAIYFDRSVYCFGPKVHWEQKGMPSRFDLDGNRWCKLADWGAGSFRLGTVFNRKIVISGFQESYLCSYSIDIDAFSWIPYDFIEKNSNKILINANERLYLISSCNGSVYESEVGNEYAWQKIGQSIIKNDFYQVYFSYNKEGVYISCISESIRKYYKFDLISKVLSEIAYYDRHVALRKVSDRIEAIERHNHSFSLIPEYAAALINDKHTLFYLGAQLGKIEFYNETIKINPNYPGCYSEKGRVLYELKLYSEAIECFNKAIILSPSYYDAHLNKGYALAGLNRHLEAIECFDKVINIKPRNTNAYWNKGIALSKLERHLEAIGCYDEWIKIHPSSIAYSDKGLALNTLGRNLEAIECYNEAIRLKPDNCMTYFYKSAALEALERYLEAIECYNKFIELRPDAASGYNNKGHALYNLGRSEEAIECYNEAIKLDHNSAKYYTNKGFALRKLKRYLEEIECYNEVIKMLPNPSGYYRLKGIALKNLSRDLEAIECFSEAIKLDPTDDEAYQDKGNALDELGRTLEAIECYSEAIRLNPSSAESYFDKGYDLITLERYIEAVECYTEAIKLKPDDALAYSNKGAALSGLGRNLEAIECYNEAIKLSPSTANFYFGKGIALNALGRFLEAVECYYETLKLDPNNAQAHLNKGYALYNLGLMSEAIKCYDEAMRLHPDLPAAFCYKGRALYSLGRMLEAIEHFNEAIKLSPDEFLYLCCRAQLLNDLERETEAQQDLNRAYNLLQSVQESKITKSPQEGNYNFNNEISDKDRLKLLQTLSKLQESVIEFKEELEKFKKSLPENPEKLREAEKKGGKAKKQHSQILKKALDCLDLKKLQPISTLQQIEREAIEHQKKIIDIIAQLWLSLSTK
ncbi:unnamed protein product [Blepharisma stoltei]|uniref:UDP-N-acetylglucosamine--peptide N-acetylglucosaminyltransferase SPINDLY n=1 Tax=Blepharisma stoltei TaxID=1481888 RepID=A0AAU9JR72_9CILI|nr:unnamed protein product [Blepharisma stoltei]